MTFSFNQQEFGFTGEIPAELARYIVPGSQASVLINEELKLLLQEFSTPVARILYSVYLIHKKSTFRIKDEGPFFFAFLSLQNDRHLEIEGLGKIVVKEGQYNFFYSPHYDVISQQEDIREYFTLAIRYERSVLQEWAPYFPDLAAFLEKVDAGQPAQMLPTNEWMTKEIQDTHYRIMHPSKENGAASLYLDLLVRTLLFHLLYQAVQKTDASHYSNYEVNGIQAARDIIRKNIRYHFVIRDIAQRVGMNEFKLKNGFREMFGNGVYEYLRLERMQEARHLLNGTGRSIKEIANLTGYKSVNSFIKAFKKMYGRTPGDFRKRA